MDRHLVDNYSAGEGEQPEEFGYEEQIAEERELHYLLSKIVRSLNFSLIVGIAVGLITFTGHFLFLQIYQSNIPFKIRLLLPVVMSFSFVASYILIFRSHISELSRRKKVIAKLLDQLVLSINTRQSKIYNDKVQQRKEAFSAMPLSKEPKRPYAYGGV